MAISRFLPPLNGTNYVKQVNQPYVDDIFDPLFTRDVREYYDSIYGNNLFGKLAGIGSGYAQMWENALTGKKGILGPGMGILSTFGRSMDKADDAILGTLTEGVNALGQVTGGLNEMPSNPLANIFVEDQDYSGTRLLAAIGNNMARLAGTNNPLTEQDFTTLGDRLSGMTLDLATDPGIAGSQLARLNPNTPVGQMGQFMNDYDDFMANVAGNVTLPGSKFTLSKLINNLRDINKGVAVSTTQPYANVQLHPKTNKPITATINNYMDSASGSGNASMPLQAPLSPEYIRQLGQQAMEASNDTIISNPEAFDAYEKLVEETKAKYAKNVKSEAQFKQYELEQEMLEKLEKDLQNKAKDTANTIKQKTSKYMSDLGEEGNKLIANKPEWFTPKSGYALPDDLNNIIVKTIDEKGEPHEHILKLEYAIENLENLSVEESTALEQTVDDLEAYVVSKWEKMSSEGADRLGLVNETPTSKYAPKNDSSSYNPANKAWETLGYIQEERFKDDYKGYLQYLLDKAKTLADVNFKSPLQLTSSEIAKNSISAPEQLRNISYYVAKLRSELPDTIFKRDTLTKEIPELSNIAPYSGNNNVLADLDMIANNKYLKIDTPKGAKRVTAKYIRPNQIQEIRNRLLKITSEYDPVTKKYHLTQTGIIPWIRENENVLYPLSERGNKTAKALLDFADGIEENVFKPSALVEYTMDSANPNIALDKLSTASLWNKALRWDLVLQDPEKNLKTLVENIKTFDIDFSPTATAADIEKYQPLLDVLKDADTGVKTYKYKLEDFKNIDVFDVDAMSAQIIKKQNEIHTKSSALALEYAKAQNNLNVMIERLEPKKAAIELTVPKSMQTILEEQRENIMLAPVKSYLGISSDSSIEVTLSALNDIDSNKANDLYQYIIDTSNTVRMNQTGRVKDTLKTDYCTHDLKNADKLERFNGKAFKNYVNIITTRKDDIIKGDEIISDIINTKSLYKDIALPVRAKAEADKLLKEIQDMVTLYNSKASSNIFKVIDVTDNGTRYIGYALDTDNMDIVKQLKRVKNIKANDITFYRGNKSLKVPTEYAPLQEHFRNVARNTSEMSGFLGVVQNDEDYIHLAMAPTVESAIESDKHLKLIGVKKPSDALLFQLTNPDNGLVPPNKLGVLNTSRSRMGPTLLYPGMYSDNIRYVTQHSYIDGMFDNKDAQTALATFFNKDLSIKYRIKDVDELWECLHPMNGSTKFGNANNLAVISAVTDENGALIKLKHYDKTSKTALAKAFEDDYAILIPENSISHLDYLLKQDIGRNSGFIRKSLNTAGTAYKASILARLGFPIGNIFDALSKQATEFSNKYESSFVEEFINATRNGYQARVLANNFEDKVMIPFRQFLSSDLAKHDPIFKKYNTEKVGISMDMVFDDPKLNNAFNTYINKYMDDGPDRNLAITMQELSTWTNPAFSKYTKKDPTAPRNLINKDLQSLSDVNNPYSEQNIISKILFGDNATKSSLGPQGLANNSFSRGVLTASEDAEVGVHIGTILNAMEHRGYDIDKLMESCGFTQHISEEAYKELRIALLEANDAMYTTNFNYQSISKIQMLLNKIIPFPTFYLKNMAYWLGVAIEHPQHIDNTISVQGALWQGKDTSDEFAAEAKGRGAIPVGSNNKHLTGIVKPTPQNSMFGAFNSINNPVSDLAFRINPTHSGLTRHLMEPEDVKYRPYNMDVYQKNIKKDDKEFSNLAYMFHRLNPYEQPMNTYLRTPKKVSNNSWQLSDLFPSLFQPDFKK